MDPKQEREAGARTLFTNRAQCVPEPTAHHALYTMLSQGYEKLDTFPKAVRQQPRHSSDSSSDSNGTTEEDEDRTEMYQPEDGRDQMCDLDSEDQAEYELVTPGGTAPSFVVEGETVYTQVFLDLQGKTPVPQKKESSTTIYCSIQKPQKVRTIFSIS